MLQPKNKQMNQKQDPQQDMYDIFTSQGIRICGQIADRIKGKASIDILGNTLFEIVRKVETEAAKQGIVFEPPVVLAGAQEILDYLIRITGAEVGEREVRGIIGLAVGKYLKYALSSGKIAKEQLQQYAAQDQQYQAQQGGLFPQQGAQTVQGGQANGLG